MTGRRQDAMAARGFVTTTVALLMLLVVSVLIFYVNKGIWLEQRTAINQYQAKQAFNAAEAGLEYVLSALNATSTTVPPRRSTYLTPCPTNLQPGTCQPGTFTIGTPMVTGSPSAGQAFSVSIERVSGETGYVDRFLLTATGGSDCTTAGTMNTCNGKAVVSQIVDLTPLLLNPPNDAVSALGQVVINGISAAIDGGSVGYAVRTGAANVSTSAANLSLPALSGNCVFGRAMCGSFSSVGTAAGFFSSFFGATQSEVKAMTTAVTDGSNFSSSTSGLVWHQGTLNLNKDVGSQSDPVLLIVEGDLAIAGNRTIHGLVYVTGNFTFNGGGNSSLSGALIVAGTTTTNGGIEISMNTRTLAQLKASASSFSKVPGTWRDWTP